MDSELGKRLNALNEQNEKLSQAEGQFLRLDAEKKTLLAKLTSQQDAKSYVERESRALATQDWMDFSKGLAVVEADYLFHKRRYAILEQAFYAELNTFKRDSEIIPKFKVQT